MEIYHLDFRPRFHILYGETNNAALPANGDPDAYMELLVIIPTYNEAQNLPPMAEALFGLDLDLGLLVVDDGSPDGTGDLAEELKEKYPAVMVLHREGKLGLGSAYCQGFRPGTRADRSPLSGPDGR